MYMKEELVFAAGGRSNYRIPSIVVDGNGCVFAFCNDRKDSLADHADEVSLVCARRRTGGEWEPVRELAGVPGWACSMGSAVCDEMTNTVMCSGQRIPVARNEFGSYTQEQIAEMEARAELRARELGIRKGPFLLFTSDGGETWQERALEIEKVKHVHWDGTVAQLDGSCHGSAHGIQLRHGPHRGRLLCPSRTQIGEYSDWDGLRKCVYNNAIYSDDHGATWKASAPVQLATGEGALIELADGTITYNSRAYYRDQKRYLATSVDGGATYGDFRTDDFLLEEENIGCNASFLRVERDQIRDAFLLPDDADGVTVFANPRSKVRDNMTACISFDGGRTWAKTQNIWKGPCAYSSLAFSEKEQRFFLMYEKGEKRPYESGVAIAEFDLEWLLSQPDH